MAEIVGARPEEVILMNSLTVNLHMMLATFYRPSEKRFKILMEGKVIAKNERLVETDG